MPSSNKKKKKKKKKNSKPPPPSSPYSVSPSPTIDIDEHLLSSILDISSAKFPSLISNTAFVTTLSNHTVSDNSSKIWLSESAMLTNSISPATLVSVSLCVSDLETVDTGDFPLTELTDECRKYFGFRLGFGGDAGCFFALATVYPSCKIQKNGVRISSNLSYTLGCPASGRMVFVYPVKDVPSIQNGNTKPFGPESNCFSSKSCKELFLSLVALKDKFGTEAAISSRLGPATNGEVGNSETLSPKTPSFSESRTGSPFPMQSQTLTFNKSESTSNFGQPSSDLHDLQLVFGDDSSRKLLEVCTSSWLCSRTLISGNLVIVPVLSRLCIFQVVGSERKLPDKEYLREDAICAFSINRATKIHFLLPGDSVVGTGLGHKRDDTIPNLPKLGGVSKEFTILKDIIVSSAVKGTVASFGLRPTKGVLLHGPPGTGKTSLVRVTVHDLGLNLFTVNGPEIISEYHGESEQALHEVFAKASQATPAVVFIDEIDAIAPARKDGGDELSQRMVATLLNLMDGISRSDGLLIIAATNRPDSIEPALRRPGRLDREIEIGVPSPVQRREILLVLLSEMQHSLLNKDVQQLAMATHGFVGADIAALCNEAALVCLRQCVNAVSYHDEPEFKLSTIAFDSVFRTTKQSGDIHANYDTNAPKTLRDPASELEDSVFSTSETNDVFGVMENGVRNDTLRITYEDFEKARVRVRPSAMREVNLEVPKVRWEDVGGQREVKLQLIEAVEWPLKHKEDFRRIGTRPPSGILLFGPPGCSKTLLARAVASEAGLNFLAVKGPELFSKWVGESEKAVRSLFAKARANSPSIVFFDEIDGLAVIRGKESDGVSVGDRVMSQLLVEMDGLQQRGSVTVIAATNRPDKIDPALLRPGRFDRLLYVGPPNKKDREDIFRVHLQRMPCRTDVSINDLSLLTEGCTGADISLICREAGIAAMEENISATEITMEHLKYGIRQVQPSDIQIYEKLSKKFQRLVHSTAEGVDCDVNKEPESILVRCHNFVEFIARYSQDG